MIPHTPSPRVRPIELRRLHRYFGRTRAVCDVTFEVPRGEVFGYIGPNGAGKTTSMRILATLDLPTYGDALVDGFSVVNDPDRVRRRLGFMPDYFGTYPNVDCYEYLDFFARAYGLVGRERHQAVQPHDGVHRPGPAGREADPHLVQRHEAAAVPGPRHDPRSVGARAGRAGRRPRPAARIELREMIRQLAADGKTILVSSHILTEMAEMCDRVGIIEQGRLLATGTVAEIQRGQAPQSEVRVRVIGGGDALRAVAGAACRCPAYRGGRGTASGSRHDGGRAEQAELLRQLVQAGFRIDEFATHQQSLEDVFMQVTRGAVQ